MRLIPEIIASTPHRWLISFNREVGRESVAFKVSEMRLDEAAEDLETVSVYFSEYAEAYEAFVGPSLFSPEWE